MSKIYSNFFEFSQLFEAEVGSILLLSTRQNTYKTTMLKIL